jgi:hypothetical protein|tara:strand:- start:41 stop:1207 length:1167 start_codon:yes stop_codon:yes gene_type:complete
MAKPADFVVDNASGSVVRQDINDIFGALRSNNGEYTGAPSTKYKYMWYADASEGKMSFYQANASDKIDFISLTDGSFFGPNGTASNPSYTFSNSTNTGFFRSAANEIGTSCNAFNVATFKQTGVDVAGDLTIQHPTGANSDLNILATGDSDDAVIDLIADGTYTDYGLRLIRKDTANAGSQILHRGTGSLELNTDDVAPIVFTTNSTERARLDATGIFMVGQTSEYDSTVYDTNGSGVIQCGGLHGNRPGISCTQNSASSTIAIGFQTTAAGPVGSISTAGSATSFNAAPSDRTLKQNFEDWNEEVLTLFKNINPQKFNFISDTAGTEKTKGFIAQDMVSSFPEAYPKLSGKYMFNPSGMVTYLMKGLQEAVAKIETLEAKVAVLEGS